MRHLLCALAMLAMLTMGVSASGGPQATLTVTVVPPASLLPSDRNASANWRMAGLQSVGGIPNRTTQCGSTLNPIGGGSDDTTNLQNAINACGTDQVLVLGAGTFTLSSGAVSIGRRMVVRGQGAGSTILHRTNGAIMGTLISPTVPIFRMGGGFNISATYALASDAAHGSYTVTTSSPPTGVVVGSLINVDQLANGSAMPSPDWLTSGGVANQVWAATDYGWMWNGHNPTIGSFDSAACLFGANNFNCGSTDPTAYSIRAGGVIEEYHLVTGVSGNTITFDSPLGRSYHAANSAAIELFNPSNLVQYAGIENLTMEYGGDGNVIIQGCVYCWMKNIESRYYFNPGIHFQQGSFRDQLDTYWAHEGAWPVNGGGGYSIALTYGVSELYIVNGISMLANKVIVMRASGVGVVVAYNYMDDGYINGNPSWVETGLNCSHMVSPGLALFEGNQSFNADSDYTHGASPYCTYFRNNITGIRATFTGLDGKLRNDAAGCCSPMRAAASHPYTYWTSFLGNVLGTAGVTTAANGWDYKNNAFTNKHLLMLGWNDANVGGTNVTGPDNVAATIYPTDPRTISTAGSYASANGCMTAAYPCTSIVDGNFDFVNNQQTWASNDTAHVLPSSLYLSAKPAFFNAGSGYAWPWVTPNNSTTPVQPGPPIPGVGGSPPTTSIFNGVSGVTLSNSNRTATGNTGGSDIQVNDARYMTGVSGKQVYYELACAGNNGTTGGGGPGYANAYGLRGWLGKDANSAGYVLGAGANNYQANGVYTAGQWGGCVSGDTVGMLLDATVTPMTLAVKVLHSGTWGAMSTAHAVPTGLTASSPFLVPTADIKANGEAYTICANAGCAASPSGLPSGAVWLDALGIYNAQPGVTNYSGLPAKARWDACQPSPTASCIMTQP